MNYLAHLVLSPVSDDILFGNYIADSIRPKQQIGWNEEMRLGYEMHIDIDQYTDRHPAFRQAKDLLVPTHKKYAPVVLDILNDHLLAINWSKLFHEDFFSWEGRIYDRLAPFQKLELPEKARKLIDGLITFQYLHVYGSQEGTLDVLSRMDKRTTFISNFILGIQDLNANYRIFEELFFELFTNLAAEFPPELKLK